MFKIWLIEKNSEEYQCFWESIEFHSYQNIVIIPKEILSSFLKEWEVFLHRIYPLKKKKDIKKWNSEILPVFYEKSFFLHRTLFKEHSEEIMNIFQQLYKNQMHTIIFILDSFVVNLPFELLLMQNKNQEEFTCIYENFCIIRKIRMQGIIQKREEKRSKVFIILNLASELQYTKEEVRNLKNIIKKFNINYKEFSEYNFKISHFLESLSIAKYFHFVGHSTQKGFGIGEEIISGDILSSLDLSNLEIIFLNSCDSTYYSEEFSNILLGFMKGGVKNVIGYNNIIEDEVSSFISKKFWEQVLKGDQTISEILLNIKKMIIKKYGKLDPANYLLQYFGEFKENRKNQTYNRKKILMTIFILFIFLLIFGVFFWNYNKNSNNTLNLQENNKKDQIQKKQSKLEEVIQIFLTKPHPFYTMEEKKKIIDEILKKSITDEEKIILLKNEIY